MKRLCRVLILAVLMNTLAPLPAALAQQSGAPAANPLREQIARLESIERDPSTSPEVRELNRGFLRARREQLRTELKKRIGSLVGYLSSSGPLLGEDEVKAVRASIDSLTSELRSLGGDAAPANGPDDSKAVAFLPASFTPAETVSRPTAPSDATSAVTPHDAGGGAAKAGEGATPSSAPECDKTLSDGDTVTYSVANFDSSLPGKIDKARILKANVTDVINGTVYAKDGTKTDPLDGDYCIVHIIEWLIKGDEQSAASKADVLREHWALYKYDGSNNAWVAEPAQKGTRIFGKSRVNVLAIHLNAGSTWDIDYTVSVTKKTPTNVANVLDLASIITSGKLAGANAKGKPPARWGGGLMCINAIPSDIAVEGEVVVRNGDREAVQQPKTYSKTYDNEGKYWWDVSIGVPLKEVKEVQFNASDGTVTAKEVTRQNAYGFLNLFVFGKQDLKSDGFLKVPHLLFGVPISKKPLDRPVIGLGYGFHKFSINFDMYAGVVFNRVREPRTLGVGASATEGQLEADFQTRRVRKFIFGVNLPLRQVKDALSGSK